MPKHMKKCPTECNPEFCKCWCHKRQKRDDREEAIDRCKIPIAQRTCDNCSCKENCKKEIVVDDKVIEIFYCTAWRSK